MVDFSWRICELESDGIWYVSHAGLTRSKALRIAGELMKDDKPVMIKQYLGE